MPTFAEWEARRRGLSPPVAANAAPVEDTTAGPLGEMRHATAGDDYLSAAEGELLRTGKEAAIGLARSPIDIAKGLYNTVAHPLDTLMGVGHAVVHPVETVENLAKHPREAGSVLGQLLLAPKVPEAANTALAEGPTVVGRGMSAVGRGMEAVGTSKVAKVAKKYGPVEAVLRGDPYGVAAAATPYALEYGGKGLQKLGDSLDGLDLSIKENPFKRTAAPPEAALDPEADTVRETVRTARDLKDGGMSAKQAAQRAGWPLGKSTEVPYQAPSEPVNPDLFPYQKDSLQAIREAASVQKLADKFRDNAWANDKSAQIDAPTDSRISNLDMPPPTADEPAPFFDEGMRPLAETGRPTMGPARLSPLDELARLSGRMKSPADVDRLLKKFGGQGT